MRQSAAAPPAGRTQEVSHSFSQISKRAFDAFCSFYRAKDPIFVCRCVCVQRRKQTVCKTLVSSQKMEKTDGGHGCTCDPAAQPDKLFIKIFLKCWCCETSEVAVEPRIQSKHQQTQRWMMGKLRIWSEKMESIGSPNTSGLTLTEQGTKRCALRIVKKTLSDLLSCSQA